MPAAKGYWKRYLVIFERSQPFGPVARLDAAGQSPGAGRAAFPVPLQRPQLLESYLSAREIQKDAVHKSFVPVETDPGHVRVSLPYLTIQIRRWLCVLWPEIIPLATHKQRHIAGSFNIGSPPVICLGRILFRQLVITPAVYPIAAAHRFYPPKPLVGGARPIVAPG